jgi:hypothetical protein
MSSIPIFVIAAVLSAAPALLHADLKAAMAEPDLGKRSKLALDNAAAALKATREAYNRDEKDKVAADANEILESVNLASESLKATGKNPRRSPKWFKQAEIATRDLLKKLETLQHDMNFEERNVLDKAKARTQEVHDELLVGLMEGKRK